jgi:hypothetical protein
MSEVALTAAGLVLAFALSGAMTLSESLTGFLDSLFSFLASFESTFLGALGSSDFAFEGAGLLSVFLMGFSAFIDSSFSLAILVLQAADWQKPTHFADVRLSNLYRQLL